MDALGAGFVMDNLLIQNRFVKFDSGSVIMWGCMTFDGPCIFCKLERRVNRYQYFNILQRNLLDTMEVYDLNLASLTF